MALIEGFRVRNYRAWRDITLGKTSTQQTSEQAIQFEIYYREAKGQRPITYEPAINLDETGRPFIESEVLKQRRKNQRSGRPYPFLRLHRGVGKVWAGEDAVETASGEADRAQEDVALTDLRQLGIAALGCAH